MKELDDSIFDRASEKAMNKALAQTLKERVDAMGIDTYSLIMEQLKQSIIDTEEVAALEQEVNEATDKNAVILNALNKGGAMAKALNEAIKNI